MAVRYNLNIDNYVNGIVIKSIGGINKALDNTKQYIDSITPEDTKRLLTNNRINYARINGDKVVGRVYNDTPYAIYVEYGVQGKEYIYHKPKGVPFYQGVGNRTFARAYDDTLYKNLQIIKQSLGL